MDLRLTIFSSLLILLLALEVGFPRREKSEARQKRWPSNLLISFINSLLLKLILPFTAISAAIYANSLGFGLMNWITLPFWLVVILTVVLLDLAIYFQHVATHKYNFLWKLHRLHHSDIDFDVTTGVRFHPLEALLSMIYKVTIIFLLGFPAQAVLVYEIILSSCALFSHANLKLPLGLDKFLQKIIVTPDMHRIHHSTEQIETDSNYGNFLSLWDRIFGTYREKPLHSQETMLLGLETFRHDSRLDKMLTQPFRKP